MASSPGCNSSAVESPRPESLEGVIDVHCHCGPDSIERAIDAIDLARLARSRGMRGVVLKNHYECTTSMAYLARKEVPGIEVFGAVDLNLSVGGINPAAVNYMVNVKGGWGRVVWMPSFDAENQVRDSKEDRPFVPVSSHGELLPAVREVISIIAAHDLVLATGHSSPDECLMLIREARRQGVKHVVVTHAMIAPTRMQLPQMREAARLGAYIEFVYNGLVGPNKMFDFSDYRGAIRALGVEVCILATDLGQAVNPPHPDGMAALIRGLSDLGFTGGELSRMSRENPARLLGLSAPNEAHTGAAPKEFDR
jgi:hypothetical protein